MKRDFHDETLRVGDTESDLELRFLPLRHLRIGRPVETGRGVEDVVGLLVPL